MQAELTKYTTFYKNKHQGHKLDWDHSLGTATLRARFGRGEKELSVSLYQALVLMLFNEDVHLGFADIKERTRIGEWSMRIPLICVCIDSHCIENKNRGRGVAEDVAEFGVGEEAGVEEGAGREGGARRGCVSLQRRFPGRSVPSAHQLDSSERNGEYGYGPNCSTSNRL